MPNDPPSWQLEGTIARLESGLLEATIDVQRPDLGLQSVVSLLSGKPVRVKSARLLGLQAGDPCDAAVVIQDAYTRGRDVIVTFHPAALPAVALQVYWRAVGDDARAVAGVEAIVSAQTELLDSDPTSTVSSCLPPGETFLLTGDEMPSLRPLAVDTAEPIRATGGILVRCGGTDFSLLEMVHASDDRGWTIQRSGSMLATRYRVLTERLEKGVIRRSRLRTMVLPRDNDREVALELYRDFVDSPAPLTT